MVKQPSIMDFIRQTKEGGKHFTDSAKSCEYFPTPSNSRPDDGHLGDNVRDKGPALWRPINPAAKPNTDTAPGGSKRRSEKY
jgi:hypothetical protein